MSRRDEERLRDVLAAIAAIQDHLQRGELRDDLVFDAVRVRLMEIGEAAKALGRDLVANEPDVPWRQIVGMRDRLAHGYFDTSRAIIQATVERDLPELEAVVRRLLAQVTDEPDEATAAAEGRPSSRRNGRIGDVDLHVDGPPLRRRADACSRSSPVP